MKRPSVLVLFLALAAASASVAVAAEPQPVSPGEFDRATRLQGACPTFSWSAADGADGYELLVFQPERDGLIEGTEDALRVPIDAAATTYTLSAESCLERGADYAWSVRARRAGIAGPWSEARLFALAARPSADEVAEALAVLQAHLAAGGSLEAAKRAGEEAPRRRPAASQGGGGEGAALSGGPAAVGISGDVAGTGGATWGVYGVSHSAAGAGLAADNTAGGADLLLDGAVPAQITESGLSRTAATLQSFDFANPGAGAMRLTVDGVEVRTAATDANTTYGAGNQLALAGTTFNVVEGPSSGLDADTVDGLDSSAFLAAGADLWVNTTGDTMTGTLGLDPAYPAPALRLHGEPFLHDNGVASIALGAGALAAEVEGEGNSAVGFQALNALTAGYDNTALGREALSGLVDGYDNTAVGAFTLAAATNAFRNSAFGTHALAGVTTGAANTGVGHESLEAATVASGNTAVGHRSLKNAKADDNTALGVQAAEFVTTGARNIAIGRQAGSSLTTGSDNIAIGSPGGSAESGAIRVGTPGTHTTAFVAGIHGASTTSSLPVFVESGGKLGTGGTIAASLIADGPGSGLDADTLDGLDASAFLTVAADQWVDTAGDTMTGTLALNPAAPVPALTLHGAAFLHDNGTASVALGAGALGNVVSGQRNVAIGFDALNDLIDGSDNAAVGWEALHRVTTGYANTAVGSAALQDATTGWANTAVGYYALPEVTTGVANVGLGAYALNSVTGSSGNTALGYNALLIARSDDNTAVGVHAAENVTTGTRNIAIGRNAGVSLATGSDNILIGSPGDGEEESNESGAIRLGTPGTHTTAYVAGIHSVTTGGAAIAVMVDANGQLGTVSSSARYKENVRDLAEVAVRLHQLRPVSFRYKSELQPGERPMEYGLIAEEVAAVFPELAVYDAQGRPDTVRYHLLVPLLLAELQKQARELAALRAEIRGQR